jgi:hypothetical protein
MNKAVKFCSKVGLQYGVRSSAKKDNINRIEYNHTLSELFADFSIIINKITAYTLKKCLVKRI